ncbi:MAG TPA: UpxY family transcription antiterminator [Clostridia bacterium]|nr:UpxY family transcription antiterminator [Clostridia bacterium]
MNEASNQHTEQTVEARWYVACTLPRHEKQVAAQLDLKQVKYYLPLYETVRRWKDRNAQVQLPLFPGYVFVHIPLSERLRVLGLASVHRFVSFNGPPVAIADDEIARLRHAISGLNAEPHPYLKIGERVRVRRGPLASSEGVLIRKKNAYRVVLNIDAIMRAVSVEVDVADLEKLN